MKTNTTLMIIKKIVVKIMGLFNRNKNKKPSPFNRLKDECKNRNIPLAYFYGWHNHIGNPSLNDEVIDEFLNRPYLLYKVELRVELFLPESENVVRGASLSGDGFVSSKRKQVKVKCPVYFAGKGVVFKEAVNDSMDLRLPWTDIVDCMRSKKSVDLVCDGVKYSVKFQSEDTALLFSDFVKEHMSGSVDDGWS